MSKFFFAFGMLLFSLQLIAQPLQRVNPKRVGMDPKKFVYADEVIQKAIDNREIPGAVLAVVRNGKMAYIKAYGNKQVYPDTVAMTVNTVFDLASVSKSVSTAMCAMVLLEQGKIRLLDNVSLYIPGFEGWEDEAGNKTNIKIVDLLTHTSGLPPYANVAEVKANYGSPNPSGLISYISTCKRDFAPKSKFQYSCLNYITLQRIIETVSGQNLRDFAKQHVFDVLGMTSTDYKPTGELLARCASTEKQPDGSVLKGEVHDPLARIMNGGISGNAGVFSTADDLAILATALLNGGEYHKKRILGPQTVRAMRTVPREVSSFGRTLGWDIYSPYASNTGDLFSSYTFGHTGYTGTSFVVDPYTNTAVILLTNAVHPEDKGSVVRLRSLVSNIVAGAIVE